MATPSNGIGPGTTTFLEDQELVTAVSLVVPEAPRVTEKSWVKVREVRFGEKVPVVAVPGGVVCDGEGLRPGELKSVDIVPFPDVPLTCASALSKKFVSPGPLGNKVTA